MATSPQSEDSSQTEGASREDSSSQDSQPRRHRWLIIIGPVALVLAVIGGLIYYWYSTFYESTDDAYIEGHPVAVSARVSGNIVQVHVADNQRVDAGELLAEIDPCDYEIRLAEAQAAVQTAQANEEQASADIEVAKAERAKARQDLHRYQELIKENAAARQDLDHSLAAARVADANLNAAEKRLAAARAQTAESRAAVEAARLQLSYTRVQAPQAGYVTQKSVEEGSYVSVGQPLLTLVTEDLYVTANFKETQLTHMRPGQPVTISVDAYPSLTLKGRVQSIQAGTGAVFSLFPPQNATGNFVKVVQRVPVKIIFEKPADPNYFLALGMSVQPRVTVK
jgi:membrane fusion protein (multidrug efflux system)